MTDSKFFILSRICAILYLSWFILLILELTNLISGSGYSLTALTLKLMFDIFKDMENPIMPEEIKERNIKQTKSFLIFMLIIMGALTVMMSSDMYELLMYLSLSATISGIICIAIFSKKKQ